ncbi:LAMI_0B01398g1_1 [Lachancea mirantina]|uniref:Chromatin modification-related protein EAF7 n=1 Tax=Lachancea mirantina TaxID=1230905 RepID=A0A1G4ITR9_9SACH|nr:LAMI_0B01398g1_1 [Lachancea mirantina]
MSEPWSTEDEIRLLRWIGEFKPIGVNKHFHMISILEKLNNPDKFPVVLLFDKLKSGAQRTYLAQDVWTKLADYYVLEKLDKMDDALEAEHENGNRDSDGLSGPMRTNWTSKREFSLPWEEYGELMVSNARDGLETAPDAKNDEDSISPASVASADNGPVRRVTRSAVTTRSNARTTRSHATESDAAPQDVKDSAPEPVPEPESEPKREPDQPISDDDDHQAPAEARSKPELEKPPLKRTRVSTRTQTASVATASAATAADEPLQPVPETADDTAAAGKKGKKPSTAASKDTATPAPRASSRVASRLRNRK